MELFLRNRFILGVAAVPVSGTATSLFARLGSLTFINLLSLITPKYTSGVKYSVLKYSCTAVAVSTVDADGAAACGNDARHAVLLEHLPCGLKQGHQHVSPDGHGVRLGWRRAPSRAFAP